MVTKNVTTIRRVGLGALLVVALATGAFAQDYYFTTFQVANKDYTLPGAPCVVQGSVQPVVYDRSIWMVYTCTDGNVIARRFFHPTDNVNPDYSYLPAPKPGDPTTPFATPTAAPACDATQMVGFTGLNECQWRARYPTR
jgi:hypothetical protein